jgi:PLP dependent protein
MMQFGINLLIIVSINFKQMNKRAMRIAVKLTDIEDNIAKACRTAKRNKNTICLLAVSKKQPISKLIEAYEAGIRAFGENYLQEALEKMTQLSNYDVQWHFIGPIQSNKTKAIAENFDWVHSIDRIKIARRLNEQRPASSPPLNVFIQANLTNEATKSGLSQETLKQLLVEIGQLPRLKLQGLMTLPPKSNDNDEQFNYFKALYDLQNKLNNELNLNMQHLSMGMSADYKAAIAAGTTLIRIGTALFGPRES